MPFPTFKKEHREPIFCWLYGKAKGGKTTLTLDFFRENNPGVIIPMDQRFEEYQKLALVENVQVWPVSDPADPTLWASADHILESLRKNFPGSGARALAWDSITPEFRQHVEWAIGYADMTPKEREKALGAKFKNKSALYQPKAHYMELVAILANYGVSCLWISHEHEGMDHEGKEAVKTSITDQEKLKFQKNVNLTLKVVKEGRGYGVQIEEARNRPELNGKIFWDEPGNMFRGMWKKIEAAFYAAEVVNWEAIEVFASDRQAADLAVRQTREVGEEIIGAFKNVNHALNTLNQVKTRLGKKASGRDLATAWKAEVATRLDAAVQEYLASLQTQPALKDKERQEATLSYEATTPEEVVKEAQAQALVRAVTQLEAERHAAHPPAQDEEPLEERFDFTLFCDQVITRLPFFQDVAHVISVMESLSLGYDSDKEAHLLDALNAHIQAIPTFETWDAFLKQLRQDFKLTDEKKIRAILKKAGFSSWPATTNGEREKQTKRMYDAVRLEMLRRQAAPEQATEEEIPL